MRIFPKLNKKFVHKWIAILAIIFNLWPLWTEFGRYCDYKFYTPYLIRNSYIADIKADLLDRELAKKHLDNFNKMGHNGIVNFSVTERPRPIRIEIRKLGETFYEHLRGDSILAYTQADENGCLIVMGNDSITEEQFRNTLIHEFLHCYFYDHVKDSSDVMYWEDNSFVDMEPSIRRYAKEVEDRIK